MRTEIFCKWLTKLDEKFRLANWQILLLVKGAKSYYNPNKELSKEENNEKSSNKESESKSEEVEELETE
ncbi:14290_t:CDS:1, partial [Racocetra fulgida]